jgi:hypothetical protein
LLIRASRGRLSASPESNAQAIANPFYRLEPIQRLILTALHRGRWSYERLSRVLGERAETIEELAWAARVELAVSAKGTGLFPKVSYPAGARQAGSHCPEYLAGRPWTQRFLDEEIRAGSERLFFQNHLMACDSCRAALSRCRELYYAIEALIPGADLDSAERGPEGKGDGPGWIERLGAISSQSNKVRHPVELSFTETLAIFVRHRETQVLLCILAVLAIMRVMGI